MKIGEFLNRDDVVCKIELSKEQWDRVFNLIGDKLNRKLQEGYVYLKPFSCFKIGTKKLGENKVFNLVDYFNNPKEKEIIFICFKNKETYLQL